MFAVTTVDGTPPDLQTVIRRTIAVPAAGAAGTTAMYYKSRIAEGARSFYDRTDGSFCLSVNHRRLLRLVVSSFV